MDTLTNDRFTSRSLTAGERPRKFFEYWVTGHGVFPYDMLRYDGCWPATGEDAAKVEWRPDLGEQTEARRKPRSVKIWSHKEPTVDRWSSFNWSVGRGEQR